MVAAREQMKMEAYDVQLPTFLQGHADGSKVAIYLRGISTTYLRERENLMGDLGDNCLEVGDMDDIVFDKRPGNNSNYAEASAYVAIKWSQAAIVRMWQFLQLRGREVALQPDSAPAATSLRQGVMGEGGKG